MTILPWLTAKTFRSLWLPAIVALAALVLVRPAFALRIRDATRLKNEVPNELVGMGLIVGLPGTGDGDDYMPAMRPLGEMMKRFNNPVTLTRELKDSKNVAIVSLSMPIPPQGAHSGDRLDVTVSAIAAKSLKGGRLVFVPLYSPTPEKMILATTSGDLTVDRDNPAKATIHEGGVMLEDILPEEIHNNTFTLVLHPTMASRELATAIADQINEDVSPQTSGQPVAYAVDATSVQVKIPPAEQQNPTPFISRVITLPLPSLPDPARVIINKKDKTIIFSDEVEVAPVLICHGNMTINIGNAPRAAAGNGPFVVVDPHGRGNAKLKDLQAALNMLKVSTDDWIGIIKDLDEQHALKAELKIIE